MVSSVSYRNNIEDQYQVKFMDKKIKKLSLRSGEDIQADEAGTYFKHFISCRVLVLDR